ncbi:P-loop containing nucleoside triphosphate hydrolases superfamily protein isoform X4 [Carex rostrata]
MESMKSKGETYCIFFFIRPLEAVTSVPSHDKMLLRLLYLLCTEDIQWNLLVPRLSVLICDACALVSKRVSLSKGDSGSLFDEEEDTSFSKDTERDKSCWTEFWSQWNLTSRECSQWRCIPLLWYTAMFQVDPMNLPISFSMVIFWVLSRVSVADLSSGNERMSQSVDEWLVSHAGEISWCFKWETPNGSNDGGDGKESKNSVEVAAATCTLLLRSLKRFSMQFVVQLQKQELQRQWTWAPAMAESLVLLLVDPNDIVRQAGRAILEYVSQNRMLTAGLQFLCSSAASLSAMYLGLRYALRLVQVDPISQNFPNLHHIFFVMRKLLKEVVNPDQSPSGFHKGSPSTVRPLTEGGFLRQPGFSDPLNQLSKCMPSLVDMQSWEDFCYFLSTILWPFMVKCLEKRGIIFDEKNCEMASVRLLEVLPFVVERLCLGLSSTREDYLRENFLFPELAWLSHLANWGKSSLVVLTRHWKQCILSVLQILRGSLSTGPTQLLLALEAMVYKDKIDMEKFLEKASACEGSALSKEAPATTRPLAPLLDVDAITTERAQPKPKPKPSSDNSNHLVIQEARRATTKLEADVISSAKPPTILEGRGYSKDKKPTKQSEAAAIAGKKPPLKPAEPEALALASEKKQLKPPAKEESQKQLKQIVQEDDQPDPLDVALDKMRQTLIPRPPLSLTKTLPLPPKRQVVQLPMQNGSRNNTLFGNRNTSVMRFKRSNFEQWYKQILQMDYFSAVVGISKNNGHKEKDSNATLKKVPLSFQSETQYLDIFRPLVLEELKAQLRAAYMESSIEDMVCGSFSVLSVERIDEFLVVRGRPNEKEFPRNQAGCFENDLILLTKEPFQNTEQSVHVLGKVDRREKGDRDQPMILVIRFLISNEISRFIRVRKFLTERSKWFLNKVFNLTPQMREFQALSSLHDIPILPIILNPLNVNVPHTRVARPAQLHEAPLSRLDEPIRNFLTSSYNHSQLQAIDVATKKPIDGKDFELTLIQGPPGTGKTRTIVAIVSALLASPLVQRKNSSSSSQYCPGNRQGRNSSSSSSVMRAWQDLPLAQQLMKQSFSSEGEFEGAERSLRGRILICAQSNAAVDELLSRLGEGLIGSDGQKYKPYIVRVGNQQTIHPSSLPFFIDTLVQQKLSEDMKSKKADAKSGKAEFESTSSVRARLEKVVDDIRKYEARRAKLNSTDGEDDELSKAKVVSVSRTESRDIPDDQIDAKLNQLYGQKREISSDLKIAHTNEKRLAEENRALKQKVRKQILRDAQIVLTTLSGAGGDLYSVCSEAASAGKFGIVPEHTMFDVVVIDEAAQALEPATLIPLQLLKSSKGIKCVMVGDPKQLPATVISDVASKFSYECSMFERLQRAGHPVIMLTQQYRMHPDISRFPSLHFYDGNLLNGTYMEDRFAPFHNIKCLGPYMFFDVNDGQERFAGSQSLRNESEAEAATEILKFLNKRYPSELACKKIGIITPYKSQLSLLRSKFNSILGPDAVSEMELNTVDGFQGREVDILLLSTVRANSSSSSDESGHIRTGTGGIGFVADVRRMNVALTRAKFSLWIFGNARTLQVNPHWTALMQDARQRNLFVSISRPYSFQELLPDSLGKDIIMNCKVKRFGSSMPGREREPRSGVERFGSSKQMPMLGREREPRSGVKQLGSSMQMPMPGMESEARSGVKRFGSTTQMPMPGMESEARSGVKRFGSSMQMSMPGIESELRSGAGVLMKRANENEVAVRGPGGSRNGNERSRADSKAIASGSKGRSENVGVGKRGLGELVEVAKEAAKKLCDPGECSGADVGPSKQIQTDAGHSLTREKREKRRVMPMPMPTPKTRGSKGPVAPSGSEKKKGGGEEVGERKKGKAAEASVGVGSVLNSARKRQREEVGSLLSSALIPSKKKSL